MFFEFPRRIAVKCLGRKRPTPQNNSECDLLGLALVSDLGRKVVKKVLVAIDQTVEGFLSEALQITPEQIAVQLKAEELGYL